MEFIELIHLSMAEWDSIQKPKIQLMASMSTVEEQKGDHIQVLPSFPEINAFPEVPHFLRADDYFKIEVETDGFFQDDDDIPDEIISPKIPIDKSLKHKSFK